MRTSKYLNKQFGNWICTHVGINNVQGTKSKHPAARNYYYIFSRRTTDGLCDKMVRLNSSDAAKVFRGIKLVEDIAENRKGSTEFTRKISYHFI